MSLEYPAEHFVGTPPLGRWAIEQGIKAAAVVRSKWLVPLEVIARYESDFDPYIQSTVCPDCVGMMQCASGMYRSAYDAGFIKSIDYTHPVQAVVVAIRYIQSKLSGYGGYGGITRLLERDDRGPGLLLRTWIEHPDWSVAKLRPYYRGY